MDEARAAATRIIKEGKRAAEVVGRIRSLMKRNTPKMSVVDMNALIDDVLTLTRHEILRYGVALRTELAADLPLITGDPVQLQQVILNLVVNAIQATRARSEDSRELLLTSQGQEPQLIVITIRDSGVGIDPSHADQLFKPFFTTKDGGLGIGFSISRSAIEAHRGTVVGLGQRRAWSNFSLLPSRR